MTPEEMSARLDLPIDECGSDSAHAIVHAIHMIELGHRISVAGAADPNSPRLRSPADSTDIAVSLYRANSRLRFFLSTELHQGLVAFRFGRNKDKTFLERDFWILPPTWRIDLPTGKKFYEIFEHRPDDPNYACGMDLQNCRARIVTSVPLPGLKDTKTQESFRWSPGHSPNELEPARLPFEWRDGLPSVKKARDYA